MEHVLPFCSKPCLQLKQFDGLFKHFSHFELHLEIEKY